MTECNPKVSPGPCCMKNEPRSQRPPENPEPHDAPEAGTRGRFLKVGQCLYKHRSSQVYYALLKKGGKQFRKSLKTTDRKLAERRLSTFSGAVKRLKATAAAASTNDLFATIADRWAGTFQGLLKPSSYQRKQLAVKNLKTAFEGKLIREITTSDCEAWASKRSLNASASTLNKEREALICIFGYAEREGFVLENPAEHVKRRKVSTKKSVIPNQDEFKKLVTTLRSADVRYSDAANFVELLAYSGMRLAEASALRWEDIDFGRKIFAVTGGELGTKNREARMVPLFPALAELLQRLKPRDGAPAQGPIVPITTAKKAIASGCKKAGLPRFTHHHLRHYFCSNAIEAGIDYKVIANWLGHKDGGILVAKTYGHLRAPHSHEMAKRMTFSAATPEGGQ